MFYILEKWKTLGNFIWKWRNDVGKSILVQISFRCMEVGSLLRSNLSTCWEHSTFKENHEYFWRFCFFFFFFIRNKFQYIFKNSLGRLGWVLEWGGVGYYKSLHVCPKINIIPIFGLSNSPLALFNSPSCTIQFPLVHCSNSPSRFCHIVQLPLSLPSISTGLGLGIAQYPQYFLFFFQSRPD